MNEVGRHSCTHRNSRGTITAKTVVSGNTIPYNDYFLCDIDADDSQEANDFCGALLLWFYGCSALLIAFMVAAAYLLRRAFEARF